MRLEKIKLAGFKSFVDPTTILFPANMVGIVGPNGCGKSNVIDAVRWVMGESSAKHLRGELMADVVFNGSSSRKPVSQAVVELVFDNSAGTLRGEYAAYQQISLKRQVNREGQSAYFLNGTSCRRRDITDLFLGTGLGARSYAIIEQGTISRLIEAKPAELRVFLEEAAGISKYKERRRETENRIQRTRENLERITDLCGELDTQCKQLKRQASTAQRFKVLKAQERELKNQLLVLRWRALDEDDQRQQKQLSEQNLRLERAVAKQAVLTAKLDNSRAEYERQREARDGAQARFYAHGAELSQAENTLNNLQNTQLQEQAEFDRLSKEVLEAEGSLALDQQQLLSSSQLNQQLQNSIELKTGHEQVNKVAVKAAEQAMAAWQESWDRYTQLKSEAQRKIEVVKATIKQAQLQLQKSKQRELLLIKDQQAAQLNLSDSGLGEKEQDLEQQLLEQASQQQKIELLQQQAASLYQQVDEHNQALASAQAKHSKNAGRLSAIEVLDKASRQDSAKSLKASLEQLSLASNRRLSEMLEVESGWEIAVETVLAEALSAIYVEDLSQIESIESQITSQLAFVSFSSSTQAEVLPASALAKVISSKARGLSLFKNIHLANTYPEAQALLQGLAADQSVITRAGVWLRNDYIVLKRGGKQAGSVLERVKERKQLTALQVILSDEITSLISAIKELKSCLDETEQSTKQLQKEGVRTAQRLSDLRQQVNVQHSKIAQAKQRLEHVAGDISLLQKELVNDQGHIEVEQGSLLLLTADAEKITLQGASLEQQKVPQQNQLKTARSAMQSMREHVHGLQLKQEGARSSQALIVKNTELVQRQLDNMLSQISTLEQSLALSVEPIQLQKQQLQILLDKKKLVEVALVTAGESLERHEKAIAQFDSERGVCEQDVLTVREQLSSAQLEHQEVLVRKQTLAEQVSEAGAEFDQLLLKLKAEDSEATWQVELTALSLKIERLGAINLTAIEEFEVQLKRKSYLEEQQEDLDASLLLLEQAVAKIDKESRSRFKATFDKVNVGFEKRFPKLFGGGRAYLELTSKDLLATGISVMAQPPGKRNSTIHLLSGGEKALTAVALVFAIFDLNPAPFCMLDEVDAPLDEANVGRFSELVAEMSEQVQMILITHNKRTMERMDQLAGVTMKEAGVSRIVAVDIKAAVDMVAVPA